MRKSFLREALFHSLTTDGMKKVIIIPPELLDIYP